MIIGQLYKITFDSLENHNPTRESLIATFAPTENKTAYLQACIYIRKLPKENLYLGYDKIIYPKDVYKEIHTS